MLIRAVSPFALALAHFLASPAPAQAEISLTWAEINFTTNRVDVISAAGNVRPGAETTHLTAGDTLSTSASSQVELLFNDGSLVRVGEQADFRFWPENRVLRLDQGTALLFIPPGQGRTLIQTPNALTGLQNTAVVVRYVPARNLTLVMVLADSVQGPVSLTATLNGEESLLSAGQVAFIDDTGIQIVEFDLLEFYRTSDLISGLNLSDLNRRPQPGDPIAFLRPGLLTALEEQQPFSDPGSILNPALIRNPSSAPSLFATEGDSLLSTDLLQQVGGLSAYDQAPAGVVTPLPEILEPGNPSDIEPLEQINLANPGGEVGDPPNLELPTLENSTVETGAAGVGAEPQ